MTERDKGITSTSASGEGTTSMGVSGEGNHEHGH
jgi:hypothetical protein